MSKFYNEKEFHSWIASGFYGDTIIEVCKTKQNIINLNKDNVVYHTGKKYWHPNWKYHLSANIDVLSFLNSVRFVKGVIFDFDQGDFNHSLENTNYKVEFVDNPPIPNWQNNIRKDVDLNLWPKRFKAGALEQKKIAVLHPVSTKNKPPEQFEEHYLPVWKETVETLKSKEYKIIIIGGKEDEVTLYKHYPYLINDKEILNLVNKLSFFESLDLVWNYSDLNVSCCSWTAWYSKAARKKTAMAAGYDMVHDLLSIRTYKYELVGNNDRSVMEFAFKKEECDNTISNWINKL